MNDFENVLIIKYPNLSPEIYIVLIIVKKYIEKPLFTTGFSEDSENIPLRT